MKLSQDQLSALETIKTSRQKLFFLTGKAGTGKSTVIQHLKNKKMTATTGIAALAINGTTVHKFLGLRPNAKFANPKTFNKRAQGYDYLIVDEISMMGNELFGLFMYAYRNTKWTGKIIFVGDFAQLPPVRDQPCYVNPEWAYVRVLSLTTTHRQESNEFLDVLEDVRNANLTERVLTFLRSKITPTPKDALVLASRTEAVNKVNYDRMMELLADGREFIDCPSRIKIHSQYLNDEKCKQDILKNSRALFSVRLFIGARLMTTRNEKTFVNGTVGTVVAYDSRSISLEDDDGFVHNIERIEHEFFDGEGRTTYTQTQFPVLYAWAITLHKSQGMTLKRAHIDLDNHFAEGQTYVGLSRLSSPEGLTVSGDLSCLQLKALQNIPS